MVSPPEGIDCVEYHFWVPTDEWQDWKQFVDDSLDARLRELIRADTAADGALLPDETNTERQSLEWLRDTLNERQTELDAKQEQLAEREAELEEKEHRLNEWASELSAKEDALDDRQEQLEDHERRLSELGATVSYLNDNETFNLLRLKLGRCNARANSAAEKIRNDNADAALVTVDKIAELTQPFARET